MTNVGKILVVLLTLFAVLFMGFAVTVFTTRTNWRENYNKKKEELDKLTKQKQGLEQIVEALKADIQREATNHSNERKAFKQAIEKLEASYTELNDNLKQARGDVVKNQKDAELYGEQAKARLDEAVMLRSQLDDTRKKMHEAQKIQFETQQKFIELKGSFETLEARAKELEQRRAELVQILQSRGLSTDIRDHGELAKIPPPVEGVILEVDPQGKYVKISLGSDDGLRKQHQLQVYRVKPQGKFVCTIEVTDVDPDQAVCRIIPKYKQGNIERGDLVATWITASR